MPLYCISEISNSSEFFLKYVVNSENEKIINLFIFATFYL